MHPGTSPHAGRQLLFWLESADTMFTGDIVYVERILGNGGQSNAKSWIEAFDEMAAFRPPAHIAPAMATRRDMATARADTYQYLKKPA